MNYVQGADCSRVCTAAELTAIEAEFVVRYFSAFPSKNMTLPEVQGLSAAGKNIVAVYEDDVNDFFGGFDAGVSRANRFVSEANGVQMPVSRPGYFAVDMNANPSDPRLHAYFGGIGSVIGAGRAGAYGSTAVVRALYAAGLIKWRWRSMSTGWAGGSGSDTDFNLEQTGYINSDFDRDVAITSDYGQWRIGWAGPESGIATISVSVVDMCARNDPHNAPGKTTNFGEVYPVQRGLAAEGMFGARKWIPGLFDLNTRAAYTVWQEHLGYRGSDADGIPGIQSLTVLGNKHSFKVVA